MFKFYFDKEQSCVCPDRLLISQIGLDKSFFSGDAITFTISDKLIIEGRRPHQNPGLQGRYWKESNCFCLWIDHPIYLSEICSKLIQPLFNSETIFYFTSEFIIYGLLLDEISEQNLILSPNREFHRIEFLTKCTKDYREDCKYWTSKIKNLDVAYYHILTGEE